MTRISNFDIFILLAKPISYALTAFLSLIQTVCAVIDTEMNMALSDSDTPVVGERIYLQLFYLEL